MESVVYPFIYIKIAYCSTAAFILTTQIFKDVICSPNNIKIKIKITKSTLEGQKVSY